MNARRLTLACTLLIISLAAILPRSRQAESAQEPRRAANHPAAAAGNGATGEPVQAQAVAGTILRTLVYHEITSLNRSAIAEIAQGFPLLSKNGNRAVFTIITGDGMRHIFVINSDGTGQREIDSNDSFAPFLDISADGSKVLYTNRNLIRMANADGTNLHDVVNIGGGFIQVRLSADGTKVFFTVDRDFPIGSENLTKGLYVINADGSGRRQIVSGATLATLLGAPAGGNNFVSTSGTSLDASADASHIIFGTSIDGKGQYLLGVNFDGSGLHQILGPVDFLNHAVISGDGLKVAYDLTLPPCCSTPSEAGVINFDGTQKKTLVTQTAPFRGYPGSGTPIQLGADGSRLLFGTGVLFNTATGEALQLAAIGGNFSSDPQFLVNEGMRVATMNSSATRFLYLAPDPNNVLQLVTLDLNPTSLGLAPSVTDPKLDPTFVITSGRGRATLSAKVSASGTLVRVNNSILFKGLTNANAFNGLTDNNVDWLVLLDDGTHGDTTVNDGIFTNNSLGANCCAVLGSRLVRVKAEARGTDSKRHATAIDFEPLTVTDQVPSIDVSQTSLDFGSVSVGQSKDLTLTIRNVGTSQLTVNSLNSDNTQFSVPPPPAAPFTIAPGGQQTITVRFTPSAVGPQGGRLTINSTDPARPNIDVFLSGVGATLSVTVNDHRTSGGPIPDNCAPPALKSSFTPADAQVFQWTFVSGFQNGAVIRWEWVQPNGTIYRQFQAPVNNTSQFVCFWDAIGIAGQPAASLPGTWQVRVFYNGTQIVTDTFTISAASSCPTAGGINPTSGAAGTSVIITGANFTGVTVVRFANNLTANFTVNSDTQITATVPGGAVTGPITIGKPNCPDVQTSTFTICTYSISPTSQNFAAGGGTGSVGVTTQSGCAWTATSNAGFITITAGTPGSGNGTVNYSVAANTSTSARSGTMTIAGQTFTVNQSGSTTGAPLIRIEPGALSFNVPRGQSSGPVSSAASQIEPQQSTAAAAQDKDEIEKEREEEGDHVEEYREWFYGQRQYPFTDIPAGARERAIREKERAAERMRASSTEEAKAAVSQWTSLGPSMTGTGRYGNVSGRITSIIVNPNDPNVVYLGAAQGGVWKTTNNGANWIPLTDDQPSLAIGSLAFDPNNPNIVYAGTGEQNFAGDSYYGNGVLKSTDGGASWSVLGASVFARQTIGRIAINASNTQVIFAAAGNGLYRTTDGGATWTRVLPGALRAATDVVVTTTAVYAGIASDGVYKSTDGGSNWTKLTAGLPAGGFFRVHLSSSAASPNTLVALLATNGALEGIYRTTDGGANWGKTADTPTGIFGGQGFYDISLGLHPTNSNIIYFGGIDVGRTTDGGASWTNLTKGYQGGAVHTDQHAIAFNPQNPAVVWIGNDGGVWRSDNGGDTWANLNQGLGIAQFQNIALHPTDNNINYGGTQDNGMQKYTGSSVWRESFPGDGGPVIVDFNTPTTVYGEYIHLQLFKSTDSGNPNTWPAATNGIPFVKGNADGRSAFYAPVAMDPTNPLKLAAATYRVFYTTDGAGNWASVSGDLTGGQVINAITFAAGGARLWTGSTDAQVWRGDLVNGSWAWTNVNKAPLPNRFVTRIAAHPTDPQTAYISYSGFGTDHVFKTTDGGTTWTSANGGLPDIPVNVVLVDPNNPGTVYAGTDIGVYRSTDQGQNWTPYGTGLPNVAVFDLAIRKNGNLLRVGTHGRGMWEIQTTGEQSFTIYNDGDATLTVTGITKQNNSPWFSFTTPSAIPFDVPPKGSVPVRVSINATGLNAGVFTDRLLVTSNDTARSPYPTGVFINLNVTDSGGGGGCTFTISPSSQSFNASGGTGSVGVTAPGGCPWTAVANDSWITITSGASGSGNGTVSYAVAANTGASSRAGTLTVAGQTFTVTQSGGSNCTFTLSPTSQNFGASGGSGSVNVTTQGGCNWAAKSNADWIVITSGASGAGNGAVGFIVAANNSTSTRSGTMTIAGQTFTVTQTGGSGCVFTISPANQVFAATGGNGSTSVSTQSGCNWTAQSNDDWIVITAGASGGGGGTVSYAVAANNSPVPRAGTITVAGQTFVVGELGTGATCGLTPISIGQTVSGELATTDCRSPIDGTDFYADLWYFTASAGQQVAISLNSAEFDAFLTLIGPDGAIVDDDDDGGGGTNARIPATNGFITLPLDGTYIIEASSAFKDETGKYTLSLIAPAGCTFSISPSGQSVSANGGTGSVSVTTQGGCAWTATSNVDWIVITSGSSGAGNGAVNYSVAANASSSPRTGTLTVAGQTFTVTQPGGSNCTFTLSPTSQNFGASGGAGSVSVTTQTGCNWVAQSSADWITITAGASGSGSGAANYSVAVNNGVARTGTLTVAGQTFTVTQSASSNCTFTLSPTIQSFDAKGGNGSVGVSTSAGCTWTAASNVTWIAVLAGTESGQGSGSVGYSVAANTASSSRQGTITIAGQTFTVTQSGGGSSSCIDVAISNSLTGSAGGTLTVPITVSDLTGKGVLSYDATITFDQSVLRPQSAPFDRTGTLSSAMTVTANTATAGQVHISAFSASALVGAGALLNLKFDVIGAAGSCSSLNWASFKFNEGTPCATTANGRACAGGGSMSGTVTYCVTPKPVPGVVVTASGTPAASNTTNGFGVFQVSGLGGGAYTLTPAKTGDTNGITSFDAALVALSVVGANTLTACQQVAGDASNNGSLSSFDAALIAQYVVGISNPSNFTGTWKFTPPSRSYASVSGDQTGQNFDAVLVGDVSGNWTPGAGIASNQFALSTDSAGAVAQTTVSLPSITATSGTSITIPITVGDLTGRNVIAYDFDLTFDQNLLQPMNPAFDAAGTLSGAMTITPNATPGRLRVSAFGTTALAGSGTLLNLKFNVIGSGAATGLTWQKFLLNEETLGQSNLTSGSVNVNRLVTTVSAANYKGADLAAESIVAAFGSSLATSIAAASTIPLPTSLVGTTVKVKDSAGIERLAALFFVAPLQVNYQLPPGTAPGPAVITITSGDGSVSSGAINIVSVEPSLFTANSDGQGAPAAYVIRVRADNSQSIEAVARFDAVQSKFLPAPLDLGPPSDQIFLVLFGTGVRFRSSLPAVSAKIGGVDARVDYAGQQGGFVGLDQLNVFVPRALAGRGEVDIALTVDGRTANTVKVNIK